LTFALAEQRVALGPSSRQTPGCSKIGRYGTNEKELRGTITNFPGGPFQVNTSFRSRFRQRPGAALNGVALLPIDGRIIDFFLRHRGTGQTK
jgi:hypothetical protein